MLVPEYRQTVQALDVADVNYNSIDCRGLAFQIHNTTQAGNMVHQFLVMSLFFFPTLPATLGFTFNFPSVMRGPYTLIDNFTFNLVVFLSFTSSYFA